MVSRVIWGHGRVGPAPLRLILLGICACWCFWPRLQALADSDVTAGQQDYYYAAADEAAYFADLQADIMGVYAANAAYCGSEASMPYLVNLPVEEENVVRVAEGIQLEISTAAQSCPPVAAMSAQAKTIYSKILANDKDIKQGISRTAAENPLTAEALAKSYDAGIKKDGLTIPNKGVPGKGSWFGGLYDPEMNPNDPTFFVDKKGAMGELQGEYIAMRWEGTARQWANQKVLVTNVNNGLSAVVLVGKGDKGPYAKGRTIDMSKELMDKLGGETDVTDFKVTFAKDDAPLGMVGAAPSPAPAIGPEEQQVLLLRELGKVADAAASAAQAGSAATLTTASGCKTAAAKLQGLSARLEPAAQKINGLNEQIKSTGVLCDEGTSASALQETMDSGGVQDAATSSFFEKYGTPLQTVAQHGRASTNRTSFSIVKYIKHGLSRLASLFSRKKNMEEGKRLLPSSSSRDGLRDWFRLGWLDPVLPVAYAGVAGSGLRSVCMPARPSAETRLTCAMQASPELGRMFRNVPGGAGTLFRRLEARIGVSRNEFLGAEPVSFARVTQIMTRRTPAQAPVVTKFYEMMKAKYSAKSAGPGPGQVVINQNVASPRPGATHTSPQAGAPEREMKGQSWEDRMAQLERDLANDPAMTALNAPGTLSQSDPQDLSDDAWMGNPIEPIFKRIEDRYRKLQMERKLIP